MIPEDFQHFLSIRSRIAGALMKKFKIANKLNEFKKKTDQYIVFN